MFRRGPPATDVPSMETRPALQVSRLRTPGRGTGRALKGFAVMFEPSSYDALTTAAVGAAILLTAWLPMLLKRLPLSLPIVAMAAG